MDEHKFLFSTYFFREPEKPSEALFWCTFCTLQCSSKIDFDMHCSGKSHAKKLALHQLSGKNVNEISTPADTTNVVKIAQAPQTVNHISFSTTYNVNATFR